MSCRSSPNLIFWTVAQTGKVTPLVSGPPGCGKSRTVEAFAKGDGPPVLHAHRLAARAGRHGRLSLPVHGEQPYMAVMPPKRAQDCRPAKGGVPRRVDHLPAGRASGAAGRDRREAGGRRDAARCDLEAAACNPPDCAANGSELEPPLANRLCHLTWETDVEAWQRGMGNCLGFPAAELSCPSARTGRSASAATRSLVGGFPQARPGLLEAYPKDRAKASGAWPSIRSWTNAAICAAALEAIDTEPLLRYRAIAGCVGEEAVLEFQTWEQSLDLPDPEAWLLKATVLPGDAQGRLAQLHIPPAAIRSWRCWPRWWTA